MPGDYLSYGALRRLRLPCALLIRNFALPKRARSRSSRISRSCLRSQSRSRLTPRSQPSGAINHIIGPNAKTTSGDVIRREVTVFWSVKHDPGNVTTGWNYKDGSGGVPVRQYCYYDFLNGDGSATKVDIASDGSRLLQISASLVPDLEGALAKCQWWHAEVADLR